MLGCGGGGGGGSGGGSGGSTGSGGGSGGSTGSGGGSGGSTGSGGATTFPCPLTSPGTLLQCKEGLEYCITNLENGGGLACRPLPTGCASCACFTLDAPACERCMQSTGGELTYVMAVNGCP